MPCELQKKKKGKRMNEKTKEGIKRIIEILKEKKS